jgi:hypothetical protein
MTTISANELAHLIERWRLQAAQHADRRDSYTAHVLRSCAADLAQLVEQQ